MRKFHVEKFHRLLSGAANCAARGHQLSQRKLLQIVEKAQNSPMFFFPCTVCGVVCVNHPVFDPLTKGKILSQ